MGTNTPSKARQKLIGPLSAVTPAPILCTGAVMVTRQPIIMTKGTPHRPGELIYSSLKDWHASLVVFRVHSAHSKIGNTCIVLSIHVLTHVARHERLRAVQLLAMGWRLRAMRRRCEVYDTGNSP